MFVEERYTCTGCGYGKVECLPRVTISLRPGNPGSVTHCKVSQAMEILFKPEALTQSRCECGLQGAGQNHTIPVSLPDFLFLDASFAVASATAQNARAAITADHFTLQTADGHQSSYTLTGFSIHLTGTVPHHIAITHDPDGVWRKYDDSHVSDGSEYAKQIRSESGLRCAQILRYKKESQ